MCKMTKSEAGRLGAIKTAAIIKQRYLDDPNLCGYCEQPLPYGKRTNRFCNRSCAASFNNVGVTRNFVDGAGAAKPCLQCGKTTDNLKFCSKKCYSDNCWSVYCEKVTKLGELLPIDSGYGYSPIVSKRYLAETRGHKCELCGLTHWLGKPVPLVLDHANGDPQNHKLDNVRLVCGNCNMLLPTFAGRNKGNGRKNRKEWFGE